MKYFKDNEILSLLSLVFISQAIYDAFAPVQNTNWSVFFWVCSHYLPFALIALFVGLKSKKSKKIPYFVLAIGFFIYTGIFTSKIGYDYTQFLVDVNKYRSFVLPTIVICISFILYLILHNHGNRERLH